jgi:hypothetical protein
LRLFEIFQGKSFPEREKKGKNILNMGNYYSLRKKIEPENNGEFRIRGITVFRYWCPALFHHVLDLSLLSRARASMIRVIMVRA